MFVIRDRHGFYLIKGNGLNLRHYDKDLDKAKYFETKEEAVTFLEKSYEISSFKNAVESYFNGLKVMDLEIEMMRQVMES